MFAFFITIHVLACSLLILIVLVQQGRGGGLIDSFSSAESIFGTKTNTFLVKTTSILAVVFFISCLALAFLSIQKNKSLIVTSYKPPATQEAKKEATPVVPKEQITDTDKSVSDKKDAPVQNEKIKEENVKNETESSSDPQT